MADLAVVVVSTNEPHWLRPCLTTVFARAGGIELDVVVANNSLYEETRELIESAFPQARIVTCDNHGFGHANNCGYLTTDAPFVLFLNPDTEIVAGTLANLVAELERRPRVGLVGVKQVTPDGELFPTIRRFPSVTRFWGDAVAAERLPVHTSWFGERVLDPRAYERETECDWVSGSFMLVRREALDSAGIFDERFFLFAEEVDLCQRIKNCGWQVVHLPVMTIIHHANKAGWSPRIWAQAAYSRRLYVTKHLAPLPRVASLAAMAVRFGLRAVLPGGDKENARARRVACRAALATLLGRRQPPFEHPPEQSLWPREHSGSGAER